MLWKDFSKVLGQFLRILTLIFTVPFLVALYFEFFVSDYIHPPLVSTFAFGTTILITIALSYLFRFLGRHSAGNLHRREGILLVSTVWMITSLLSSLPFLFSGTIERPVDALFEAVSGLTTTGASVLYPKAYDKATGEEIPVQMTTFGGQKVYYFHGTVAPLTNPINGEVIEEGIEAVSPPILFWRSFMQWLGGLGIIFLFIAIFPALSIGGKYLYQTELTGPFKEAVTPRIRETASYLWKIYVGLTILEILVLRVVDNQIPFFDALNITFSNISTGGFSIHDNSIGYYHSPSVEWVVILFMFLGSINFGLYYYCMKGKIYRLYEPEFLLFTAIVILGSLFLATELFELLPKGSLQGTLRTGCFQFVSALTCCGFFTADYTTWPFSAQSIMLFAMFIGGMSCSTAGGIKVIRHVIMLRAVREKVQSLFRPEAMRVMKIGEKIISAPILSMVFVFFWIVMAFSALGAIVMIIDGIDPQTALGLMACSINNVGMAFSAAGPNGSFAVLPLLSKIIMIIWMLLGRLEFFSCLILFSSAFWRSR